MPSEFIDLLLQRTSIFDSEGNLWVFGYGSLIWKPGFKYQRRILGYITDYKRRFYQGTTTHRGTEEWPGRVATLVHHKGKRTWGVAYQVSGPDDIRLALAHLAEREMITGGYRFETVIFQPADENLRIGDTNIFPAQVYIADPGNDQWLGYAPLPEQAFQIAKARGVCGYNTEYVKKVAVFMSEEIKGGYHYDSYLFELVKLVETYESAGSNAHKLLDKKVLQRLPRKVTNSCKDSELATSSQSSSCTCSLGDVVKPDLYDETRLRRSTFSQLFSCFRS